MRSCDRVAERYTSNDAWQDVSATEGVRKDIRKNIKRIKEGVRKELRKEQEKSRATVQASTRAAAWRYAKGELTRGWASAWAVVLSSDTTISECGWLMKEDACDRLTARPDGTRT